MLLQIAVIAAVGALCSCSIVPGIDTGSETTQGTGTGQSPLHVTLRAYSGVQDPAWDVQPSDPDFQQLSSALQGHASTPLPDIVGYRGFEVQDPNAFLNHTVAAGSNSGLEVLLLSSGLGSGNPETVSLVQELLCELTSDPQYCVLVVPWPTDAPPSSSSSSTTTTTTATTTNSSAPTSSTTSTPSSTKKPCKCPKYEPGKWNNNANTKQNNNCYNYATNSQTGTFAQPGRGTGNMYGALTGPAVQAGAVSDGLKNQGNPGAGKFPKTDDCLVALVIWPGRDFHWFRQDKNGNWSHKPGTTAATNLDNSGNVITDPRTADIAPYQFVTFMSYCPKDITINR